MGSGHPPNYLPPFTEYPKLPYDATSIFVPSRNGVMKKGLSPKEDVLFCTPKKAQHNDCFGAQRSPPPLLTCDTKFSSLDRGHFTFLLSPSLSSPLSSSYVRASTWLPLRSN